jgi:hypothetical protein
MDVVLRSNVPTEIILEMTINKCIQSKFHALDFGKLCGFCFVLDHFLYPFKIEITFKNLF